MACVVKDRRLSGPDGSPDHYGSPYWIACYTTADGRRLKKSTKKRDKREAMEIAIALERAERMGARGEATEARLRELLAETLERVSDGAETIRTYSAEGWMKSWFDRKRPLLAEGSVWVYQRSIDTFIEHLQGRARLSIGAITSADVQGWVNAEVKGGRAASSVRVQAKIVRAAFRRAIQEVIITGPNPAEGIDLPRGSGVERDLFTAGELDLLVAAAHGDWKTVVLIGIYTGQRLRDCANVRWSDVDLAKRFMVFRVMKKHGKKLRLPIHPTLREHFESIAGDDPAGYLAPALANQDTRGRAGLSEGFLGIMRQAGVEAGSEKSGKRTMSLRSFHSLRHTAATRLLEAGVDREIVRRITGHADSNSFTRYLHPDDETLTKAVGKLKTT